MFGFGPATRIYVATGATDLRKGFDGLYGGLWVCAKKLDRGCFRWPVADSTVKKVVLSHEELTLLLGGIDLAQTRPRKWYRKVPGKEPTESLKTA